MNIYLRLTEEFNRGRLRCIVSSGQAVVLHRLAIMSKDGDWIIREDAEATRHVLQILASHQARYRFGAPLDERWLRGGWSAHFEFREGSLRVRTDFVTRPPRISPAELAQLWREQENAPVPCVDVRRLADIKKTNREKDYAVIGELARQLTNPTDQFLYSRSAIDLQQLAAAHPDHLQSLRVQRPLLALISQGRDQLEAALDAERRALIHANEVRLARYEEAAARWAAAWPTLEATILDLDLPAAHERLYQRAAALLPETL